MNIAFFIALIVFLSMVLTAFRRDADPIAPWRVFTLMWSLAIGLAVLNLSGYQAPWSLTTWLILLTGIGSFLLGLFVPVVLHVGVRLLSVQEIRARLRSAYINKVLLFRTIIVLFIIYSLSFIAEMILEGTLPIFAAKPDVARVQFGVFGVHLFVAMVPVLLFLIVQAFVLDLFNRYEKTVLWAVFLLSMGSFSLLLQRFAFVVWGFTAFAFLYYTARHWRWKHVILVAGVLLTLFVSIQSVRLVRYVTDYIHVISRMRYSVEYAFLTEPYMYVVMNLENFARGVEKLEISTYGYFTFDFLMALSGLKHWLAEYFQFVERPFLVSGYNTFPFFWAYYYDFGVLGVVVISFLVAFAIGALYVHVRSCPTILTAVLYANAFVFLALSFFTNTLTSLSSVFNILLIMFVQLLVTRRAGQAVSGGES